MEINPTLKNQYDNQYSERTNHWRKVGAVAKVDNIMAMKGAHHFKSMIDIGAGDGNVIALLQERGFADEYTAAEISDSGIHEIKKRNFKQPVTAIQFDGYHLPFADGQFDVAVCSHVMEHVEFERQLLREIKRVSKYQIFEVPIDFSFSVDEKFDHFNNYGHINIYTPGLFKFLLKSEGYKIVNHKNAMYSNEFFRLQYHNNKKMYWITRFKCLVWKVFPFLMRSKPNTVTVLTTKRN